MLASSQLTGGTACLAFQVSSGFVFVVCLEVINAGELWHCRLRQQEHTFSLLHRAWLNLRNLCQLLFRDNQ